jgi:hypothetical protein
MGKTMNRIFVHIGLPKTGTTSLQDLFFAEHPQLAYLGQTNLWTHEDAKKVIKSILVEDYCQSIGGRETLSQVLRRLHELRIKYGTKAKQIIDHFHPDKIIGALEHLIEAVVHQG